MWPWGTLPLLLSLSLTLSPSLPLPLTLPLRRGVDRPAMLGSDPFESYLRRPETRGPGQRSNHGERRATAREHRKSMTAHAALFSWEEVDRSSDLHRLRLVVEYLPDEEIVLELERLRGNGRDT